MIDYGTSIVNLRSNWRVSALKNPHPLKTTDSAKSCLLHTSLFIAVFLTSIQVLHGSKF